MLVVQWALAVSWHQKLFGAHQFCAPACSSHNVPRTAHHWLTDPCRPAANFWQKDLALHTSPESCTTSSRWESCPCLIASDQRRTEMLRLLLFLLCSLMFYYTNCVELIVVCVNCFGIAIFVWIRLDCALIEWSHWLGCEVSWLSLSSVRITGSV